MHRRSRSSISHAESSDSEILVNIDYGVSRGQSFLRLIDVWMDPDQAIQRGASSIQALTSVMDLLSQVLKLDREDIYVVSPKHWEPNSVWTVAVKIQAVLTRSPPMETSCLVASHVPPRFTICPVTVSVCAETCCRDLVLDASKALFLVALGERDNRTDSGPYLLMPEGEDTICGIAYGTLRHGLSYLSIKLARPFHLPYVSSPQFMNWSHEHSHQIELCPEKAYPASSLWLDLECRRLDLLRMIDSLTMHELDHDPIMLGMQDNGENDAH